MRAELAEKRFAEGYNCAQSVAGVFAERYGLDEKTMDRLAASLGGGLAHTGEVCGALLGACLALGLAIGDGDVPTETEKARHSARVRLLVERFRAAFGSSGCEALRVPGDRRHCARYVRFAAETLEELLRAEARGA